jgi:hypothetical protein
MLPLVWLASVVGLWLMTPNVVVRLPWVAIRRLRSSPLHSALSPLLGKLAFCVRRPWGARGLRV